MIDLSVVVKLIVSPNEVRSNFPSEFCGDNGFEANLFLPEIMFVSSFLFFKVLYVPAEFLYLSNADFALLFGLNLSVVFKLKSMSFSIILSSVSISLELSYCLTSPGLTALYLLF